MSTSTHWTNSSLTLSPVLFLTDQHNASQNLIATTETLGGILSSDLEYCEQKIHFTHYIYSKSAHAQCDIFVNKII